MKKLTYLSVFIALNIGIVAVFAGTQTSQNEFVFNWHGDASKSSVWSVLLQGAILGFLASIIAWISMHFCMKPALKISDNVYYDDSKNRRIFTIKIENVGRIGYCHDLELYGRIVIDHRDNKGKKRQSAYDVMVGYRRYSLIESKYPWLSNNLDSRNKKETNDDYYHYDLVIPLETRCELKKDFPDVLASVSTLNDILDFVKNGKNTNTLSEKSGIEIELRVFVLSTHEYSGVRGVKEKKYEFVEKDNDSVSGDGKGAFVPRFPG